MQAPRVRVLAGGELADVDLQALPYGGGTLLDQLPVEYALDIERDSSALESSAGSSSPLRALVVGNPGRDLPMAGREVADVSKALADAHAGVTELREGAATHSAVLSALKALAPFHSLFHYAGHASMAGEDGWESALPLASGGRLTISDVLTLERAPEAVVLLGCSAAATEKGVSSATLAMAQAFLLAGSRVAVAPVKTVGDELAADFAARLYEELARDPSRGVATIACARRCVRSRRAIPPEGGARFASSRRSSIFGTRRSPIA